MSRRLLLIALALLLAACGPSGDPTPGSGHSGPLILGLVEGAGPPPEERVVLALEPADDPDAWSADAPLSGLRAPEWLPEGTPAMFQAGAARRDVQVRIRCRGAFDAASFQRVDLLVSVDGRGGLGTALELRREGRLIANSEPQRLTRFRELELLSFDVPRAAAEEGLLDELAFVVTGGRRVLAIGELRLVATSPGADLPLPEDGPALVRASTEAQPAYGLLPGRGLTGSFEVPPAGRLRLGWARPRRVAGADQGSAMDVTLTGAVERTLHLEAGAPMLDGTIPWRFHELDLAGSAGGTVQLRVELAPGAGGPSAPLALAVPRLMQRGAAPPCVLLITSDTHRADHLGAQPGNVGLSTPVVDALAARGTLFSDCFAPVNNTNPSHVALMTGTHPRDTGVLDNYQPLSDAPRTLAECFADAGYETWALLSTMHLGPEGSGLGQGFDRVSWPRVEAQREGVDTIDELLVWLRDGNERPLFIWLHLFDAHTPYTPPEEFAARVWDPAVDAFDPGLPEPDVAPQALPGELRGLRDLSYGAAMYRAEVESQDDRLRRVLEHPRLAGALVAFVADHGESLGEHDMWFDHMGAYPSTLHIPLVLAGPGVPVGRVVERPVTHLDLGATLLELAGLPDAELPGTNLLTLADSAAPAPPRFTVEAGPFAAAVTHDGWHLVLNLAERHAAAHGWPRARHQVELYDLRSDPDALRDVVAEHPAQAAALRGRLVAWLGAARSNDWLATGAVDAEMAAALAELGYVAGQGGEGGQALFEPDGCDACLPYER